MEVGKVKDERSARRTIARLATKKRRVRMTEGIKVEGAQSSEAGNVDSNGQRERRVQRERSGCYGFS